MEEASLCLPRQVFGNVIDLIDEIGLCCGICFLRYTPPRYIVGRIERILLMILFLIDTIDTIDRFFPSSYPDLLTSS